MVTRLALALLCIVGLATPALAGPILVTGAQAEMEADGTTADISMTITNTGSMPDRLYAVKSKVTSDVFFNAMSEEEEKELEAKGLEPTEALQFEVEPGEPLTLDESGAHMELRHLNQALEAGDSFLMTLFFETAGPVEVRVEVEEE